LSAIFKGYISRSSSCYRKNNHDDVQDIRLSEPSQLWRIEDTRALLQRIEDAMHWRRVSKSELAGLLGVRKGTVTQWFTLVRLPDTEVFLKLMKVLGGDPNWWMGDGGGVS
jgi:DNA-binding transcriptional regulator YiaG